MFDWDGRDVARVLVGANTPQGIIVHDCLVNSNPRVLRDTVRDKAVCEGNRGWMLWEVLVKLWEMDQLFDTITASVRDPIKIGVTYRYTDESTSSGDRISPEILYTRSNRRSKGRRLDASRAVGGTFRSKYQMLLSSAQFLSKQHGSEGAMAKSCNA